MEEIIKQWCKPLGEFIQDVKCCINCAGWPVGHTLMTHGMCEFCTLNIDKLVFFDHYCDQYDGDAKEENLIYMLTDDERHQLWLKYRD